MTQPAAERPPVQTREDATRLWGTVRLFALLMIASVIASGLDLPWSVASILASMAAVVVGIRALMTAARLRVRGTPRVALIAGLGLAGLTLLMQLAVAATWPLQWDYQQCRAGAITEAGEAACQQELEERLSRLGQLGG